MSTTSGVNVLRYSALCLGVFYGFYHQRSLSTAQQTVAAKREYEHKQDLINKAKEAYAKSKAPASATPAATSGGLNQDPMGPNFDLESYFDALFKQKA
ncbi:ATP synthase E chain-domain-containing protein [Lasiosphaeria hispida]|uniref:ATP synthase F(0) complex subunit e, mitochondrial n=1 Tax=Lasiosphaeria hispida TaxID=260671 RepID=A0AAJ0H6H7_9PEZI|nr:ATP synthase E chain-domain-containing protein [Lasiosphaeria hispida]